MENRNVSFYTDALGAYIYGRDGVHCSRAFRNMGRYWRSYVSLRPVVPERMIEPLRYNIVSTAHR